ncbi:putative DNA-binding domain-containing protein [Paracoccus sp. YLB-12]|uniref:DNA-binding domain-containing protein n=1 Tax=Paracoccus maritimus TaxID=2933292 RepID=A0ABT2KCS4_9RHOB|nr:putative DNA-binding domain-containing protein [Paracoccus sp. YLB-12]MCT4333749.1 putative DNA-binding domain-containing protein [Paracoccus sp. YLB-12]
MQQHSDSPADFTPAFRAALAGGDLPDFVTARVPDEAAIRFAVYRNNVAHSLREALARRYPVIRRLVGAEFFAAMAGEFVAAHPPATPVLQEWGDAFAGFLAGFPPVATLPYLGDVARIEWARGLSYHAADAMPMPPRRLTETAPLRLHPSLQLLRLTHPAFDIWQANQPGRDGKLRGTGPRNVLIWRRPDFEVEAMAIADPDADFLQGLMQGQPIAQAAGSTNPVPILTLLLRHGLICDKETRS